VENECTSHIFGSFPIFLPKIIEICGNLTKFWQKQICLVFLGHGVHYKSDKTVNFCGFRCATTSLITIFINVVFYIYINIVLDFQKSDIHRLLVWCLCCYSGMASLMIFGHQCQLDAEDICCTATTAVL